MDVHADDPDNHPRTPTRPAKRRLMLLTTPQGFGSGVRSSYDSDTALANKEPYHRKDYDAYIEHDLQTNRVFMHFEKFAELVLKVPADWEQDLTFLSSIATHADFQKALTDFRKSVKQAGHERRLYPPLVSLYASALKLLDESDPLDDHDRQALKLAFSRNDPVQLVDGVFGRLSPDIKALFDTFTVVEDQLSFANVVHVVEVKDTNYALCRGDNDFRVLNKGVDPLQISRGLEAKQASTPNSGRASPAASGGTNAGNSASGKRARADDNLEGSNSGRKITRQSPEDFSANREAVDSKDPDSQVHPQTQCARYAMEHLSNVILRSHSILALFDRDRFQLEYFDRSVIAVSTAVDLSTDEGQKLFVLMVYGLRRLSAEDLGLRNVVKGSLDLCTDSQSASRRMERGGPKSWRRMFYNQPMVIAKERYILKDIIFRQPGLIGRTTCVVRALRWSDMANEYVVKFSCPAKTRATEMDLIQKARQCAESDKKHAWVLNHLPNMIAFEDVDIGEDSVQARIRDFLSNADYADGNKYPYEDRCLRISVSEALWPITGLQDQRQVGQVFLDILQTHKWLYDVPKIHHRDLSMSNIMFREDDDGNLYGVPNDLDLASLLPEVESESGNTSLRRTGTPPYMALDLQNPHNSQVRHLYRHDLESLFYVLVMFVCRYEFKVDRYVLRAKPPFSDWFDWKKSWVDLKKTKSDFFHTTDPTFIASQISPGLNHFEPWVLCLQSELREGFGKKAQALAPILSFIPDETMLQAIKAGLLEAPVVEQPLKTDDETLGGKVTYWTFYKYMVRLGGEPLEVRCPNLGLPGQ